MFDLVILNEHAVSYLQSLHETLERMVESSPEQALRDKASSTEPARMVDRVAR